MDLYSTSFTIPRAAGQSAFTHDSPPTTVHSSSVIDAGHDAARAHAPAPEPPVSSVPGRFTSMRSRFPPSVKAFMPSAFGGKRSERIVEAVGAEKAEADAAVAAANDPIAAHNASLHNGGLPSAPAKPSNPTLSNLDPDYSTKNRDSQSTVGTRSSLEFSSSASFTADSTAPSSAIGVNPSSASHSASNSMSASQAERGMTPSGSSKDLGDAVQKLSIDVMANHQCLISFHPVPQQQDEARAPSTPLSHPFPRQSSYSSLHSLDQLSFSNANAAGSYPYQQYHPQPIGTPEAHSSAFLPNRRESLSGSGFPSLNASSLSLSALNPSSGHGYSSGLTSASMKSNAASHQLQQYNFHLSGGIQQVMAARGAILRDHPFKLKASIKVPRVDILDSAPGSSPPTKETVKPEVRRKLDEVQASTGVTISILAGEVPGADLGYGLETERMSELVISGPFENVELARVKVLVICDEIMGLQSEAFDIDHKLHNIIGGRKRCVVQKIEEETGTNVYMPSPFLGTFSASSRSTAIAAQQNTIYITGDFLSVQRARDMLFQVSMHKSKGVISRDAAILPRKLDWMLSDRLEELRAIMLDNGTFVAFPLIGSQASLVSVFGDNRVNIERSIRSIMQLACQFYVASLWLLPLGFDAFMPSQTNLNLSRVAPLLKHVSNASGAEVVFKSNCFEIHGLEGEVRTAISALLDFDLLKSFNFEVRFQIELANEHREFISGKKNGKINKVMKQCGVRIKFETFNDYNFLIDVSGNDRTGVLQGLGLLQEELPAEMSFHVPETYHKRIIGVGGKNIQRIMKKFGVYVKFSNAEEFTALGGYLDNEDNVIARTPAKNAINLDNLKQSVMELVNPKDKDYISETVAISRRYHRILLGDKAIFIHDIESKTSSSVRFPARESASDLVNIFGPESQIHIAAQMLLDHVPFEAEFRAPNSIELTQAIQSPEFVALTEQLKRDLSISISPQAQQQTQQQQQRAATGETIFKLKLNRSNTDFLPTAKDAIEDFLINRNAQVYATASRNRSDSFASAFPHFANKLISTAAAAESSESFHAASAAAAEQARANEHRIRAAASSPDIKALFDSPAHLQGQNYTTGVANTASNSPLITSSLYPSPYGNGRGFGSDVWGAPVRPFVQSSNNNAASNIAGMAPPGSQMGTSALPLPMSGGIQFPSQHHAKMSEDLSMNRGFDGVGMDDRMKALRKPRSLAHRTQSLDISAMTAQQIAQYQHQNQHHQNGSLSLGPSTPYNLGSIGSGASLSTPNQNQYAGMGGSHAAFQQLPHPSFAHQQPQQQQQQQQNHQHSQYPQTHQHHHNHHHASSASISRLPPSAHSQKPDAATMDDVSHVLAQLAFDRA